MPVSFIMEFTVAQIIALGKAYKAVDSPREEQKEIEAIPTEHLQAFLTKTKAFGIYEMS